MFWKLLKKIIFSFQATKFIWCVYLFKLINWQWFLWTRQGFLTHSIRFIVNINLYSIGFKVLAIHLLDLACIDAIDKSVFFRLDTNLEFWVWMTLLDFMILWSLGQFHFKQFFWDHLIFSFPERMSFMDILGSGLRHSCDLQAIGWTPIIQHLLEWLLVFEQLPCLTAGVVAFQKMMTQPS